MKSEGSGTKWDGTSRVTLIELLGGTSSAAWAVRAVETTEFRGPAGSTHATWGCRLCSCAGD